MKPHSTMRKKVCLIFTLMFLIDLNLVQAGGDAADNAIRTSKSEKNVVQRKNLAVGRIITDRPTNNPTISTGEPTESPISPTNQPSLGPTNKPTNTPSMRPTKSVPPTSTFKPSFEPTRHPSSAPSAKPSVSPTSVPSFVPSTEPSSSPSFKPTVSYMPTTSPKPSMKPSATPSSTPTGEPTVSVAPSSTPSSSPSGKPSSAPSSEPSSKPSSVPSGTPSSSPSSMPSASPTLTCHDKAEYRSPINGLKCSDHSGTDCYQWRNIGLNTTELGNLINNCPETCQIPCGAFVHFSIPVSYQLSGIPGLLDDKAKQSLEKASFDFVTEYIEVEVPDYIFEIDVVELSSQSTVSQHQRSLRQPRRDLVLEEDVLVTVVFDGFSIGLRYTEISDFLVSGMNSTGFARALQNVDKFFENAVISSAESKDDTVHEPNEEKRGGRSTATLLVGILVIIGFSIALIFALFKRGKFTKWFPSDLIGFQQNGATLAQSPQEEEASLPESSQQGRPRFFSLDFSASVQTTDSNVFSRVTSRVKGLFSQVKYHLGTSSSKSPKGDFPGSPNDKSLSQSSRFSRGGSPMNIGNLLSFDIAPQTGNNGLLRLITSNSKSSTEPDDSKSGNNPHEPEEQSPSHDLAVSPMSEGTEESIPQEHPLSNIIPPMIVIDNIDDTPSNQRKHVRSRSLVPGKRVEASPAFLSVLTGPSETPNMVFNCSELNAWKNNADGQEASRVLSPLGIIVDSDSEDDSASYASTPVQSLNEKSGLGFHRSWSANALDVLDSKKSPLHMLTTQAPPFFDPFVDNIKSPLHRLTVEAPSSPLDDIDGYGIGGDDDVSIELIFGRESSGSELSARKRNSGHERVGLINSIWAMSPGSIKNASMEPSTTPRSAKRNSIPSQRKSSVKRKEQVSPTGRYPDTFDDNRANKTLQVIDSTAIFHQPEQLNFEAPRTGQLGLVIEARSRTGPTIHSVKDYSPLFGKIQKGDKIVEIDGKNQSGSTLSDVMHLLASKSARRSSNSNLKIVVERAMRAEESYSKGDSRHTRDSSCSSRVIVDSDTFMESSP